MSANSFGQIFKVTSFGESHGYGIGVLIEGCPSGIDFDLPLLVAHLQRRKPGQSSVTTSRQEADEPIVVSGIFEGKTLGTPICILVKNKDQKSDDYSEIKNSSRIGHADDTWKEKFGHVDYRGGGRASGRETLSRVIAGSVAQMLVRKLSPDTRVKGFAESIGKFRLTSSESENIWQKDVDSYVTRFPSAQNALVITMLEKAKIDGDSYGGVIEVRMQNVAPALGQPVFHKFKADLASAMMSIGATQGFEIGDGFKSTEQTGQNFHQSMESSSYGGIRGGLTTGEEICLKVAFKPTSSIKDIAKMGRHDPCIVPRAVPVVEAMCWMIIADHLLWKRLDQIS